MKLDDIDKEILHQLQKDAHMTTKELSAILNLSATPVYERVRRLEKEKIIKNYTAVIDREKVDKDLMVFCSIRLKEHGKALGDNFVEQIQQMPEVMECYNISGDFDFLLKVLVKDMRAYQTFLITKLATLENIGGTQSNFVMSEIKVNTIIEF